MRADELRELLDRRPFEPIRLHISSGQTVDIKHPEMAFVTQSLGAPLQNCCAGRYLNATRAIDNPLKKQITIAGEA